MSKNRMVNTRFWSDGFIVDHCNALDRYLFLYLLTNEQTNIVGIYELSLRTASFDTGIERDDLARMLERLSPKVEYFDGWVYIRKFVDHQQTNPSVDKGMKRALGSIPESIINRVRDLGIDSYRLAQAVDSVLQSATDCPQSATESGKPEPEPEPELKPEPIGIIVDAGKPVDVTAKDILEVFEFYKKCFKANSQTKLSATRKEKIRMRLKDAGKDMLMQAIERTSISAHHTGDNDRGWKANIDFIIRSYEQVERLSELGAGSKERLDGYTPLSAEELERIMKGGK